jgi:ADP-heptose:LPS heptosyltransferase/GT2 family glycosyltransferase
MIGAAAAEQRGRPPDDRAASPVVVEAAPFTRKIRQSEIDLLGEALAGLGWHPSFHLVMRVDDSEAMIARCRVTLSSLAEQGFAGWRLILVARRRDADFGELIERLRDGRDDARGLRDGALASPVVTDEFRARVLHGFDRLAEKVEIVAPRPGLSFADLAADSEGRPTFIAIVGAGDQLRNDALAELALATGLDRDGALFYCDEERVNPATGAIEPFCKPQWSPDLLLSTNYIGRLWCAAPRVFDRAGGLLRDWLRQGEYDLVLRCTEEAGSIRHVPGTLYRREGDALDRAGTEISALERALTRRGIAAHVEPGCAPGFHQVRRQIAKPGRVSIIIPTRASRGLIRTCIETLRQLTDYPDFEIVCADNIPASDTATKRWLRKTADTVIAIDPPFNWSRHNNVAAHAATGDYLLFLNDDIEIIEPGWLRALVGEAQRSEVGAVGARLLYPDGTVQHAGMFLMRPWIARHAFRGKHRDDLGYFGLARTQRNVTGLTGACLMTRRDLFWQLGGFDEAHDITNNDLDFCLKVRREGLLCVYTPAATLIHHEQATRTEVSDHFDVGAFAREWRGMFARGDPYHHPALSSQVDDVVVDHEFAETVSVSRPLYDRDGIRRILVVKLDHLGDCIGAIPAIRRLKHHFPLASIDVLSGPWADPVWALVPEIDEIIHFAFYDANSSRPPRQVGSATLEELRRQLAPRRYDLAVDLRRHPETRRVLQSIGARYTAGVDYQGRFPWLDIALEWEGDRRQVAKRQYFGAALVNLVDAIAAAGERDDAMPRLDPGAASALSDPELRAAFERPVVCVHPAVGNEMRRWPAEHFARLIDLLIEGNGVNVVLIGGAEDRSVVNAVLDKVQNRDRVALAVGRVSLGELPAFLARCALFVGNNSGPKHIAAALGVPTVGVHSGNVDAREWAPAGPRAVAVRRWVECSPCYLARPSECSRALACLTELRPFDVYPVCRRLLAMGHGAAADA